MIISMLLWAKSEERNKEIMMDKELCWLKTRGTMNITRTYSGKKGTMAFKSGKPGGSWFCHAMCKTGLWQKANALNEAGETKERL
jgi:hypothetical protein